MMKTSAFFKKKLNKALMRPNLNEQCDTNILILIRNGIT